MFQGNFSITCLLCYFKKIGTYIQIYGKPTPSPLRGTPSMNRGRAKLLTIFEDVLFTLKWYIMTKNLM